jgi:hypothetical protein
VLRRAARSVRREELRLEQSDRRSPTICFERMMPSRSTS